MFLFNRLKRIKIIKQLTENLRFRTVTFAVFGLVINLIYAFYNGALGVLENSIWFIASSVYYSLLSTMRFSAILNERKDDIKKEHSVARLTGVLLIVLSFILSVIIYISISQDIVSKYDEIMMISIATFTFTKLTFAIIKAVKHRCNSSPIMKSIRTISYSEVAVSILTMQRSMLVSFGNTDPNKIKALNAFTGAGVCFFIFTLGAINLKNNRKRYINGKI